MNRITVELETGADMVLPVVASIMDGRGLEELTVKNLGGTMRVTASVRVDVGACETVNVAGAIVHELPGGTRGGLLRVTVSVDV